MNTAETVYADDAKVPFWQAVGYRCHGRTPSGHMIMRRPPAPAIVIQRSANRALEAKLAEMEGVLRRQIADLEKANERQALMTRDLRDELTAIKQRLPADHPALNRDGDPTDTWYDLAVLRRAVAQAFDVPLGRLCGKSRERPAARARHAYFALARETTTHSLPHIGGSVGRDRTSVMYGVERAETHWSKDPDFVRRQARARELADES